MAKKKPLRGAGMTPLALGAALLFTCAALLLWIALAPAPRAKAPAGTQPTLAHDPDGGAVTGRVCFADGTPVRGAWVIPATYQGQWRYGRRVATDFEGRFRMVCLPPGKYALRIAHPTGVGAVVRDVGVSRGAGAELGEPVVLHPGGAYLVRVLNGSGRLLGGAWISIRQDVGFAGQAGYPFVAWAGVTCPDGTFSGGGWAEGDYEVDVRFGASKERAVLRIRSGEVAALDVRLK